MADIYELKEKGIMPDDFDPYRLAVHAVIDNYRVRGEVFTNGVPNLVESCEIAMRILNRESDPRRVVIALLMAQFQLDFVLEIPQEFHVLFDKEKWGKFF